MKKTFTLVLTLLLLTFIAKSQSFKFGIGPVVSAPTGNFREINSLGYGAELTGILDISEKFQAFGQLGVQSFSAKKVTVLGTTIKGETTTHLPVIFGGRYNANGFLIGAGIGYGTYGKSLSGFTFSPQIGYSLDKIDIIGHLTSSSVGGENLSYAGLKVYYKF